MLLRRITEHVKDQNWFAVAIDFAIVVFGVFIGIQVANWNNQRLTTQQEIIHLQSMRTEFVQSIESAELYVENADLAIDSMMVLLRTAQGDLPELSIEAFDKHMLEGMFRFGIFGANVTTLEEMQSSGELSSIGSPELRAALTKVLNTLQNVNAREEDFLHVVTQFSDPWIVEMFDLRRLHDLDYAIVNQPELQGIRPLTADDPRDILTNHQLSNILSLKTITQVNIREQAQAILIDYREALNLVENRLRDLGGPE